VGESWSARALVNWDEGLSIPGMGLWLDPRRHVPFAFASDAFGEAYADRLIATPETVRFLRRHRTKPSFLPSPVRRSFALGEGDLTLWPAGVLPGSAQLALRYRGGTLLYFRRILPEPVGLGDTLDAPRADAVLIDSPAGAAPQACARRADTMAAIRTWAERVLERNEVPAILAEPVAAAPAIVAQLAALGSEMRLHWMIYRTLRVWAAFGLRVPRAWPLRGAPRVGQVVVLPWGDARREPAGPATTSAERDAGGSTGGRRDASGMDALIKVLGTTGADGTAVRMRIAVVHDGTAPPPAGLHPDEVFLLAFTAGVPEIMTHVQRTGATEVYLSPWTPPVVGQVLRDLGVAGVTRLGPPEQLALGGRGQVS
jgi:hypothetical protein